MAQHPGAPHMGGQAPGMGMVPGMHPGVSGPQVSQGGPMATGMPPGAGTPAPGPMPNAHAISHLGPGQQQMFQQQHPQMNFANPMMTQQHHQAALLARQRAMIAQHAQHGQHPGGMPGGLPNGAQGLNHQQLQAMQARGMQNQMNFHMQQQLQGHPGQMGQQHPQNPQLHQQQMIQQQNQANQAAMEHRNPQQMMRMPTGSNPSTQPPQPQPTPTPQVSQAPPQPSQPPQSQPTPPQQQQQPHTPQQQPPQPQQTSQAPQQQPSQPSAQGAQQRDPQRVDQAQQKPNIAAMMQQQQQQQQQRQMAAMSFGGNQILALNRFFDDLSSVDTQRASDVTHWQEFVEKHFSENGALRQQVWNSNQEGNKQFQITYGALPRYFLTQFSSGIDKITMHMEDPREGELPTGGHSVSSPRCSVTYWFKNDTHLVTFGSIRANTDVNGKIDSLDIGTSRHKEYIPRSAAQLVMDSPETKQSPEVNKKKRAAQKQAPAPSSASLPSSMVNEYGLTSAVMQFLELAETTSIMGPLFHHCQQHPNLTPEQALHDYVNKLNSFNLQQNSAMGISQGNLNAPNMQPGQRTPGIHGSNQFASPAMAHLGLPGAGSPHIGGPVHTPSPAQTHMAGPVAMVHQQSQQGSNMSGSQGTSTTTSPNMTNKRRRTSTVKTEGDDAGGEINGIVNSKVKASPRPGGKRQKAAP
ncbi:MAG: hypothetical protein Q9227_009196 [Pyrenula ochraceoflavens]